MVLGVKYSAAQIALHMGISKRAVNERATEEKWPFTKRSGKGGGRLFRIEDLPDDVRLAIAIKECPYTPSPITPAQEASLAALPSLKGKVKERVAYIVPIVSYFQSFRARSGLLITPAAEEFTVRWNAGEIEVEPWLRMAKPRICKNTILGWVAGIKEKGVAGVGGRYGVHRKGTGIVDNNPEMRAVIEGMLYEYPHVSCQLIRERLESIFTKRGEKIPSLGRLYAWVKAWKSENSSTFEFIKAPDAWRGKRMPSVGSAYEFITRQNQRWELDGTPADLLLNDGKRYTIVGVVNVYDRRVKFDVVERSTAKAVANLMRRSLLDWGIPEAAVTDCGNDFTALYMQQVFLDLGIYHDQLPPFRPDLKPGIERAFRTFSHDLLTICPGYIGHNVATRQQIRERQTFAKLLMDRKNPRELSMAWSPEELQRFCDEWAENKYAHSPHSGLNGRTPFDVARDWITPVRRIQNVRALDVLLTPLASRQGWRTVGKKGVRTPEGRYAAPELGGMIGSRVQVRVEPNDTSLAYIFDEPGNFVCRAANISGMAPEARRDLAIATRRAATSQVKAAARELRATAKSTGAANAAGEIMAHHSERAERIRQDAGTVEHRSTPHTTPALEAAGEAVNAHIPAVALTEQAREVVPGFTPPPTAQERYKLLMALQERQDLTESEAKWVRLYGASNEADGYRQMFQFCAASS